MTSCGSGASRKRAGPCGSGMRNGCLAPTSRAPSGTPAPPALTSFRVTEQKPGAIRSSPAADDACASGLLSSGGWRNGDGSHGTICGVPQKAMADPLPEARSHRPERRFRASDAGQGDARASRPRGKWRCCPSGSAVGIFEWRVKQHGRSGVGHGDLRHGTRQTVR